MDKNTFKMLARDSNLKTCLLPGLKAQKVEEQNLKDSNRMDQWKQFFELPLSFRPLFPMRSTQDISTECITDLD